MQIEKRKQGKKVKFYLAHSIRIGDKTRRIRRYLGSDLNEREIAKLRPRAEGLLLKQIEMRRNPFLYDLSEDDIKFYQKYDSKIKIEHLTAKEWEDFKEEFTYNTNAIEGSAVSEDEVKDMLENHVPPKNKDEIESVNVAEAVEYIKKTGEKLSLSLMNRLHKICFKGTKHFAGKIRDVHVVVADSSGNIVHEGAPVSQIAQLLNDLFDWYDKHRNKYPALLLACVFHNQFEKIHPYQDGNGRVGRLLLNYVLLKHNCPPVNILIEDRSAYYKCLRIFDKTGNIKPTIKFIIQQYRKSR